MKTERILPSMVKTAQANATSLLDHLPDECMSKAQARLMHRHGTPLTFGKAVIKSLGEITFAEAEAAIRKYHQEWKDAA